MVAVLVAITGDVQGVGFRAFVHRTAMTFGLAGEVWNCADGSVRVHVQHPDELHLAAFVRLLHDGPGNVDAVEVSPSVPTESTSFQIGVSR